MTISKWIIFNKQGEKLETRTIKHKDNRLYKELEPFEQEIIDKGLYAHRKESFDQFKGKRIPFKKQLECLGWQFDYEGNII